MAFDGNAWNEQFIRDYLIAYARNRPFTDEEKVALQDALLYRCIREAFVWAYRFDTLDLWKKSLFFLCAALDLKNSDFSFFDV